MTEEDLIKQFQQIEINFNEAVVSNSVAEIKNVYQTTRYWWTVKEE
jgi:hypothetical protein